MGRFSWYHAHTRGFGGYPLVICHIAVEHGPFIVDLPISMVIFHSYVSLPEGMYAHHLKYIHGLQDKIDHDNTTQCLPNNHEIRLLNIPGKTIPLGVVKNLWVPFGTHNQWPRS